MGMRVSEVGRPEGVQWVHVGDREADIFERFTQPRDPQSDLLIRAEHNRNVRHELGYLISTLEQVPVLGAMTVELQRHPKRPACIAQLMAITTEVYPQVPLPPPLIASDHPLDCPTRRISRPQA